MTTNYPTPLRVTEVHEPPLFGAAYAHVAQPSCPQFTNVSDTYMGQLPAFPLLCAPYGHHPGVLGATSWCFSDYLDMQSICGADGDTNRLAATTPSS
jgi:hypothetical protein